MTIFSDILATRGLTAIHYKCEDALAEAGLTPFERETLQAISGCNNLDLCWAFAHEQLGEHDKAAELRAWAAGASTRRQANLAKMQDML